MHGELRILQMVRRRDAVEHHDRKDSSPPSLEAAGGYNQNVGSAGFGLAVGARAHSFPVRLLPWTTSTGGDQTRFRPRWVLA